MFKEKRLLFLENITRKVDGLNIKNQVGNNVDALKVSSSDAVKKTAEALVATIKANPDLQSQFIDATIGVIKPQGNDKKAIGNPPEWLHDARNIRSDQTKNLETGYNFVGEKSYLDAVIKQLFPDIDPNTVVALSAEGGTAANAKINHFLKQIGTEGVSSGAPIWPGNKGAVERIGSMPMHLYQYLDQNKEWNFNEGFIKSLENNSNIIPMLHGICQNPLGIDIPQKYWGDIAEIANHFNIPITIDMAYLGFANGVEEDTKMIRFFEKAKVKMIIAFSDSKYLQQYSEERVGAILGINFKNHKEIQSHLVQQSREITSARAAAGQRIGAIVRTNPKIQEQHAQWQQACRDIFARNRNILLEGFPKTQKELFANSKGMFLAILGNTKDDAMKIIAYAFPELATTYFGKNNIPNDAKDFPESLKRIAMVPIEPKDNADISGARIGLSMTEDNAKSAKQTLQYVSDKVGISN